MTVIKYQAKSFVPEFPGLEIENMLVCENDIIIDAHWIATKGRCPNCMAMSCSVHSRYMRCPQDLPCSGKAVRLRITVKRFRCNNRECPRKTFTEQMPELLAYRSQRTLRCAKIQHLLALGLGGECGSRILEQLGMSISGDTLLRMIRRAELPEFETPRLLGVDDWAWRKGTDYGTVLCDLEKQQIIEILPDRDQKTFADWLKQHPGIEVITRDRAKYYIEGATIGAPDAIQIADRWHLLKNLRDKLHIQLRVYKKLLRWLPTLPVADPNSAPLRTDTVFERHRIENHQRRVARHEQILQLYEARYDVNQIADLMGVSSRTVYRWLAKSVIPERRRYLKRVTQIAPYADYVKQRWEEGCRSAREVHKELQELGFSGTHQTVDTALRRLDQRLSVLRTPPPKASKAKRLTPAKAAWWFVLPVENWMLNSKMRSTIS